MKKIIVLIIPIIVTINCFGQTHFEKGYIINNQNSRTDCFIKNSDLQKNPLLLKYKLSENGETQKAGIEDVKEFSISNSCKFIRAEVNIDISPFELIYLSTDKNPIWKHKQLFLKVLVEGKASLYYYGNESGDRFFYSSKDTTIKQLIYKEYIYDNDHIAFNDTFRVQLKNNVRCSFASDISIENLAYEKNDLIKYFIDYNTCIDPTFKVPVKIHKKGEFNLALSTGLAYSSLSISNFITSYADANFGKKLIPIFSFEVEYILPVNNNKWGVSFGPTYQSYHSEKQAKYGDVKYGDVSVDFESIDLALGIKYYFFLKDHAKLNVGVYYNSLAGHCLNSKIGYKPNGYNDFSYFDINEYRHNYCFETGFEFKRIFAELRYYSNQDLLASYPTWDSSYEKITFSIGYKIFKTRP